MKWQLLTDATSTTKAQFATVVAKGTTGDITVGGNTGGTETDKTAASQTLAANGDATYYVLVWLEETGAEQQGEDASTAETKKAYTGNITFDAVDAQGNKSGVTATFTS